MSTLTASSADPVRPWFEALESMGEFVGIRFGKVGPDGEVEWFFMSHAEYDGIGGFVHLLRERGAVINAMPQITHPGGLSWWPFIRFLPTMMKLRKVLKWREQPQGPKIEGNVPPPAVAFHVFNEQETLEIRRAARLAEVTVNSLLLKYLDRAIRPALEDPTSAIPWMVPVNLRGKVIQPTDIENHSSYVPIQIFASEGAKEVQNHIYSAIARGEHLATWKGFAATKGTSACTKKKLIDANRATSQWSVGGFSNLGVWDPDSKIKAPECQGDWLFAPPVLRFQMVGAGCVTFQGRLSLTLQLHPELTTSPEVAAGWLRAWTREIELGFSG